MKREELKKLLGESATDETIDAIMKLHGSDIESHKTKATDLQAQFDAATAQLTEANKQIESFKSMDIETVKKAAADWETKAKEAETKAAEQVAALKFDHALETSLTSAKVKNVKTILPLLSRDKLTLKDDGTIDGLEDQIKTIKESNDYLFADAKEPPKIVTGGNNQPVITDAFEAAMWKGAGLKKPES